jgi:pilus assembly protein CpaE
MSYRVLLAIGGSAGAADASVVLEEAGDAVVVGHVPATGQIVSAIQETNPDIVLLHEDLGPLPVLELARQLAASFPEVAVILAVRNQSPDLLRAALRSGVRGVVGLPFAVEEIQGALQGAGLWSRSVRERLLREPDGQVAGGGVMVALAGAKGGVGTTTLAVHLALLTARARPEVSVCLVDLDLQAGDVRSLLDLNYGRGIHDLLDVADDLTGRQLEDSLYLHPSRLRILLPPQEGEEAEAVGTRAARQILGAIRTHFDVVIVDAGTIVSDASAVAVEMADQTLVVTTPDVPALRAANRLVELWTRLQIRKDGIGVVLTRTSKDAEVQPDLVAKVVSVPLLRAAVPAAYRELEAPANTGAPDRLEDGLVRRALVGLGRELRLLPAAGGERRRRLSRQSGHVAIEALGLTPLMAVAVLLLFQMVLAGLTFVFAGHAAAEGARQLAVGGPVQDAVTADLPDLWRRSAEIEVGRDDVRVTLAVPALAPGFDTPLRVPMRAGAVIEENLPRAGGG